MLTTAQRTMRDRYAAIGFTITERPFAGTDRTKWYFANRPDSDERRSDFSVNLDTGISHQMGTNQLRTIDEAESEFGDPAGERQNVSPPIPALSAQQKQERQNAIGGLTPCRSPGKTAKPDKPAKKKQAALF